MAGTVGAKEEARLRRGQLALDFAPDLHFARGNRLVASLGKLARDFQEVLEDVVHTEEGGDIFVDPAPDLRTASALGIVQSDVLNLVGRRDDGDAPTLPLSPTDTSIEIHSCHSPMREVEVLHDRLLAMFETLENLEPRDVVVMAPAIDEYAPYVEAVFDADRSRPRIPFRLSDRAPRSAEPVVDSFFRILDLLRGRVSAPEIFDLLGLEPVRARFGMDAADLEPIREWIARSGIRWGIDEHHRSHHGQPPIRENTWAFGLDRLLLGIAMSGRGRELFAGVLPSDGIEGTDAGLLGHLSEFCETLFAFRDLPSRPRTVARWEEDLGRLLGSLVALSSATADQHRRIRRGLEALTGRAAAAVFDAEIDLDAHGHELEKGIGESSTAHGFLSGGVTFCSLVPMRSIPFRAVCLLGMNDHAFPRTVRPPSFDQTTRAPRPGDRTRRDDDRSLFLEALLAARERFLLTYVGQGIQDNSVLPPSVVVNDLLDTLADSFHLPGEPDGVVERRAHRIAHFVVRHPLQAFSERYFAKDGDGRLFSYSRSAFEGARAERAADAIPPPFLSRPLDPPETPIVTVEELERFLENPSRWFCQHRLGLHFGRDLELLEKSEPIELDALGSWQIGDSLLSRFIEGDTLEEAFSSIRASGVLPPGVLGRETYDGIACESRRIAETARPFLLGGREPPVEVEIVIDGTRLSGWLRDVYPRGQVDCRYSRLGGRHELRFWVRHLALNVVRPGTETRLVGRPSKERAPRLASFRKVDDPTSLLRALLRLHREALRSPVAFFAETSRRYVLTERHLHGRPGAEDDAYREAARAFRGNSDGGSDSADEYVRRLFGPRHEPPDDEGELGFRTVSRTVFAPLLDHREPSE
jgi:exodeoxyribonuclease V gamma subunit